MVQGEKNDGKAIKYCQLSNIENDGGKFQEN